MKSQLFKTGDHLTGLIIRFTLAIVLLPHGCQLLFGWFGGYGFNGSMDYFTEVEGLPWIIGFGVILLQFLGALFILFGFMGRAVAFALIPLFIGMIVTSHWQHGFFMNWMGAQGGEGFEFHVLALGLSAALVVSGSGSYSVDAWLTRKKNEQTLFDLASIYQ